MHQFYKILYDVRKKYTALFENSTIEFDEAALNYNLLCYSIKNNENEIYVCLNFRGEHTNFTLKNIYGNYKNVYTNEILKIENELVFATTSGGYLVLEKIDS